MTYKKSYNLIQISSFAFSRVKNLMFKLKEINYRYIIFGVNSINEYLKFITNHKPKYILGLGEYSGVDKEKIRIETICTNKFRNYFIDGNKYKEVRIPYFLQENQYMKKSKHIGNSWCNFVSWKIVNLLKEKKLTSMYTFLHIPKGMKDLLAQKYIDEALRHFKDKERLKSK